MRQGQGQAQAQGGWGSRFAANAFMVVFVSVFVPGALAAQGDHPSKAAYDHWCASCHGVEGDGQGVAATYMLPRPRDFTSALYQVRTTPSGALPTDEDILAVIDRGMPGTAMPGWESVLSRQERDQLVDYLKTFSRFFDMDEAPPPIDVGRAPRTSDERIEEGRRVYQETECWKCHGDAGRGDGTSAPTQEDDRNYPIRPADLSENWMFNGGGSVEDIYTRLRTGLDGTPMPSFSDMVDAGVITDDELWSLVLYVRSLSPAREPEVREVVRAGLVDRPLPAGPGDPAWDPVERYYVPLVGQIIVQPRWFSPTVDGVWVQALHDGEELAMRLTWHDPSSSPDPAWEPWRARLVDFMDPKEEPAATPDAPDVMTVQFPAAMSDGRELPFFLGGTASDPVYLWRWSSVDGVVEALGRGLDSRQPLDAADAAVQASAAFDAGEWSVVLRRPLETGDDERLDLVRGEAIPLAFFAQDGSSGETAHRGSISSWFYLYLDLPMAATVYTLPITTTLITAVLGLLIVARARRAAAHVHTEAGTLPEGA